jgi:hypothetical protein
MVFVIVIIISQSKVLPKTSYLMPCSSSLRSHIIAGCDLFGQSDNKGGGGPVTQIMP